MKHLTEAPLGLQEINDQSQSTQLYCHRRTRTSCSPVVLDCITTWLFLWVFGWLYLHCVTHFKITDSKVLLFFLNLLIFLDVFVFIFLLKMYSNIFLLLCLTLCQWFLNKVVLAWLNMEFSELGFIWGNEVFGMFAHWLIISGSRGCCWFRNRKKTNLQRKNKIHVARVLVSKGLLCTSINSANRVFIICTSENLFSFQLPTIDLVFKHI